MYQKAFIRPAQPSHATIQQLVDYSLDKDDVTWFRNHQIYGESYRVNQANQSQSKSKSKSKQQQKQQQQQQQQQQHQQQQPKKDLHGWDDYDYNTPIPPNSPHPHPLLYPTKNKPLSLTLNLFETMIDSLEKATHVGATVPSGEAEAIFLRRFGIQTKKGAKNG